MTASENKHLMQEAFEQLAQGNGRPFVDTLADDIRWMIVGNTAWSGTWQGLASVRAELLGPLFDQFGSTYRARLVRLIAEGDCVVIEFRGNVTTKAGKPYRNAYCYVCRMRDGKVRELSEYCDTQLLTEALGPPEPRVAA